MFSFSLRSTLLLQQRVTNSNYSRISWAHDKTNITSRGADERMNEKKIAFRKAGKKEMRTGYYLQRRAIQKLNLADGRLH
jgi:hypothetical protein